jgi:hypothetical protein
LSVLLQLQKFLDTVFLLSYYEHSLCGPIAQLVRATGS